MSRSDIPLMIGGSPGQGTSVGSVAVSLDPAEWSFRSSFSWYSSPLDQPMRKALISPIRTNKTPTPVAAIAAIRFVGSKAPSCPLSPPEVAVVFELLSRGRIARRNEDARLGRAFLYHISGDTN